MYYHCSPTAGLTLLQPNAPKHFDKPSGVYLTTCLPMALLYGIRHFEYTYGYTKSEQIYYAEYFPNALETLYRGRSASLYLCRPGNVEHTKIPNEAVSYAPVEVVEERPIPDLLEALHEQARQKAITIYTYDQLSDAFRRSIIEEETAEIKRRGLLNTPSSPMAQWMRSHYPESWQLAMRK